MFLPITEDEAAARRLRIEGQVVFAEDGSAVGDYMPESRLVRLDVPRCSPRPATAGDYPVAVGGLPASPSSMALLTTQIDQWARN